MKSVKLSKSYILHAGPADTVSFREPVFNDIMALGEPIASGVMPGGVVVRDVNYEAIQGYVERLVEKPWDPTLLGQLNVRDTQKIVRAILDFFREPETSPDALKTSSSSSDSTPAPSAP